jgi:hypothetical protein
VIGMSARWIGVHTESSFDHQACDVPRENTEKLALPRQCTDHRDDMSYSANALHKRSRNRFGPRGEGPPAPQTEKRRRLLGGATTKAWGW